MSRYIDADALIAQYKSDVLTAQVDYAEGVRDVIEDVKNAPSIDIVRCKECKHRTYCYREVHMTNKRQSVNIHEDIDFCSYGEREGE